jgi:predicted RNA-binding protein
MPMCLDHGTFLLVNGEEETPLDHVAAILAQGGRLRLVDVLGASREVAGTIGEIDLLNRRIILA